MNHVNMNPVNLEHVNLTVSDPDASADLLCNLFGWHIRWAGDAMNNGRTVHVGSADSYLALYSHPEVQKRDQNAANIANLNHIAVQVADLDEIEERVVANKLQPFNFGDYPPGKRLYIMINDDIEIEVVSYPDSCSE